jgi:hypothetical protein
MTDRREIGKYNLIDESIEELKALSFESRGNAYLFGKELVARGAYESHILKTVGNNSYGRRLIDGEKGGGKEPLLFGRINFHLARLLAQTRSPAEQKFARDFIDYGVKNYIAIAEEDCDKAFGIKKRIGAESSNVMVWWTLAPYAHRALIEAGLSPEEAINGLFEWMNDTQEKDAFYDALTLKGVDWMPSGLLFVLENNVSESDNGLMKVQSGRVREVNGDEVKLVDMNEGKYIKTTRQELGDGIKLEVGKDVVIEKPALTHRMADKIARTFVVPEVMKR